MKKFNKYRHRQTKNVNLFAKCDAFNNWKPAATKAHQFQLKLDYS